MDTRILVPAIIIIAAVVVIVALLYARKRKSEQLKERFGSEYNRVVEQHGDPRRAEAVLADREKRVSRFAIHSLSEVDCDRYSQDWMAVQNRFVDDPPGSVIEAHELVTRVMNSRGYPMSDFEQQAQDVSVNHPTVVQQYRAAHEIVLRHGKGGASTEDMRKAMVYYRSLFEELLGPTKSVQKEVA